MTKLEGPWVDHVRAWRRSKKSAAAYCEEHGLNLHTLRSWSRKMLNDKGHLSPVLSAAGLAAVRVKQDREATSSMLHLRIGKVSIDLPRDFDENSVRRVLAILGAV